MENPKVFGEIIGEIIGTVINHGLRDLHRAIAQLESKIMASFDDLKAAQAASDAKIAAIVTDIAALLAKLAAIPTAGMTADQQAALDAAVVHANAINDSLTAADASANPAPVAATAAAPDAPAA